MSNIVRDILKRDFARRQAGANIENDLFTLSDLSADETWDYSLPTMLSTWSMRDQPQFVRNVEEFEALFFRDREVLKEILNWNAHQDACKILVAGGSVGHNMSAKNHLKYGGDYDIFIHSLNTPEGRDPGEFASECVEKIMQHIIDHVTVYVTEKTTESVLRATAKCLEEGKDLASLNSNQQYSLGVRNYTWKLQSTRTNNALTMVIDSTLFGELTLQIIFRAYNSISEIIHGFDLGPSAVGFDRENVYMTELAKFCYENSVIVLDTTRRSTTYEYRIKKYMERGFRLILPDLNIKALRTGYHKYKYAEIADLEYFPFAYTRIQGNRIFYTELLGKYEYTSDYGESLTERAATSKNIMTLLRDDWEDAWYFYTSLEKDITVLKKMPDINNGKIDDIYRSLQDQVFHNGRFSYSTFAKFVRHIELSEFSAKYFSMDPKDRKEYVEQVIEIQSNICKERCEQVLAREPRPINWILENPGTQLSGSVNPIVEDPVQWYGEKLYVAPN